MLMKLTFLDIHIVECSSVNYVIFPLSQEKQNKMNAQSIATAMSPVLQTSERLLTALLCHTSAIFSNVKLSR
jgi:hypothetical protein